MAIILDQYCHLQLIQPHYRLIAFIIKATALPRTPLASKPRTKGQLRAWSSEGGSSWTGPRWGKWCWRSLPAWTRRCRWTAAARTEPERVKKGSGLEPWTPAATQRDTCRVPARLFRETHSPFVQNQILSLTENPCLLSNLSGQRILLFLLLA